MSKRALLAKTSLTVLASLATTLLLRADDPPKITTPPGYKVVYHDSGNGMKMPILVPIESDSIKNSSLGDDPLDHQKVFSETNAMANRTFAGVEGNAWNKSADGTDRAANSDKVYDTTSRGNIFDTNTKPAFATAAYDGLKPSSEADSTFATKTADVANDEAASEFAAIGASEQNRTSPYQDRSEKTFAYSPADKTFMKATADNSIKHNTGELGSGTALSDIPDRPLSIDEVKNLINHGFKPDLTQPPPPASKPLNDPNYQPEPLRIEPTTPEIPPPDTKTKVDDDDKDDPVPPPGTMADPPENSEQLPNK